MYLSYILVQAAAHASETVPVF